MGDTESLNLKTIMQNLFVIIYNGLCQMSPVTCLAFFLSYDSNDCVYAEVWAPINEADDTFTHTQRQKKQEWTAEKEEEEKND